jgi:electron transfer flavoprotein alpha subunit
LNFIVLLKQVPDITSIPPDAWNHETGTLKRSVLDNMLNQFDLHALSAAIKLREHSGGTGRIVCLTMGIRSAAEVLLEAMARGADEGIILNDSAFAGADTPATATALTAAIKKIERERFGSDSQYLILGGMQSTDGDTAQVPAQIAQALGIDLIAYVCGIEYATPVVFSRIAADGRQQRVQLTRYPAVITLTDCTLPPYATLESTRRVRTSAEPVTVWGLPDLAIDARLVGAKGSWTQVVHIFSPSQEVRNCLFADEPAQLLELLEQKLKDASRQSTAVVAGPAPEHPAYKGEVFVYAEMQDGQPAAVVSELTGQARLLAGSLGEKVGVVITAAVSEALTNQFFEWGADKVYLVNDGNIDSDDSVANASAIADVILKFVPQIVLFGATPQGRQLAPRVAYAASCGLTADCTQLAIDTHAGRQGILLQTRPALGGNIMATIISKDSRSQMATVRPGVFPGPAGESGRRGKMVRHVCKVTTGGIKVLSKGLPLAGNELASAHIIVSGGAGLRGASTFAAYLQPLAASLEKRFSLKAAVGASRRAVEHSYATRQMQVGQTGQTVSPDIYVAIGISGAVQHISAIQRSKVIVAVNSDAAAPIFKTADIGVIGKAEVVLPQLLSILGANAK